MKNKKLIIILIIITIVILVSSYFFLKNNCVSKIDYIKAVAVGTPFEKPEHYTLSGNSWDLVGKEFKTKDEAVSYCMSKIFSSGN